MEHLYNIPLNSANLPHYFSTALILPSGYFMNRLEDIQDKSGNSILLTKSRWVQNSDCSIEVILTDTEIKELKNISDNFYELELPIPISRIKKVYFLDKIQKDLTVWNINNGAAFIPEYIVSLEDGNVEFVNDDLPSKKNIIKKSTDIENKIKRFNTALGGFSFMRVGAVFLDSVSMEYSKNYFITLSNFNKLIEEHTLKAQNEKGVHFNNKYLGLFSSSESEWKKWQPYIYESINLNDFEEIAFKEGVKIEKRLGLLVMDSISESSHLFDIAILATYGDNKNKSIDDLVNNLNDGVIPESKKEDIAILFGLNTGYAKFRNKYKSKNNEYTVKFKLDSKLDYYTIESIFQFVFFGNKKSYNFTFIDNLTLPNTKQFDYKGFETFEILDKTVIAKKKPTPLEEFSQNYSNGFYEKISKALEANTPVYSKFDNDAAEVYFRELLNDSLNIALKSYERDILDEAEHTFNDEKRALILSYESKIALLENEIKKINNLLEQNTEPPKIISTSEEAQEILGQNIDIPFESFEEYEKMTLIDLKVVAKGKGIKIGGKLRRTDIIQLIKNSSSKLL